MDEVMFLKTAEVFSTAALRTYYTSSHRCFSTVSMVWDCIAFISDAISADAVMVCSASFLISLATAETLFPFHRPLQPQAAFSAKKISLACNF